MTMVALGEAARFINGVAFKPTDWGVEGLPIIRIQNLTGTGEKFNLTTRTVRPELIVEQGDLLMSWSATLDVFRWAGPRGLLNQHIFKVLPNAGVDADYLFFALKDALAELSAKTHGSTMKHVVRGDFESTCIRLPRIEEQRRIVDLMSRADGIVRLRREAQQLAAGLIPAIFQKFFGDPASNSKSWVVKTLGDLVEAIDSGKSPKCHGHQKGEGEWGVLKLSALTGGVYNEREHKTLPHNITPFVAAEVQTGDVLLSRKNTYELVGMAAYVSQTLGRILLPDLIFRLRLPVGAKVHPIFLWALLTDRSMRRQLQSLASGSAESMPNISKERLRKLLVVVPPMDLQEKFARYCESIWSVQSSQTMASLAAETTMKSVMHGVFKG